MILIVSFADNEHVRQVLRHLTRDHVVVDTAWFPSRLGLDAGVDAGGERLAFTLPDGLGVDLLDVNAVWYRRIRPMALDDALQDGTARLFAWSEANEALLGTWYSMECFWMNPPLADEVAQRKVRQLQVARRVGLSVPETLVTNRPDEARAFLLRHGPGQVVRKAFRNISQAPRETARVGPDDLALLDAVRFAPVIFQRFVRADLDLRVTVVDGEIFAAAIRSDADHQTDYRSGLGTATVTPYRLPDAVASALLALMGVFGLRFGAADFRVTPEGDHVFLEVNPAGEYLFISERTGQPIPAAIAACLERHDRGA